MFHRFLALSVVYISLHVCNQEVYINLATSTGVLTHFCLKDRALLQIILLHNEIFKFREITMYVTRLFKITFMFHAIYELING